MKRYGMVIGLRAEKLWTFAMSKNPMSTGLSRRHFIRCTVLATGATALHVPRTFPAEGKNSMPNQEGVAGAIVLCNHWTQFGIGETFSEGEIRGRWYRRNFSTVFGLEQGRRWLEADPKNRVCHEYDAYFLEALAAEDSAYLQVIRDLLDRRLMELPGGTFGQAESQVFGYESALRQLTFGQAAYRKHLGRSVDTFIVEEQNFFPQLPQLLKLAGFNYASIQFQNSGTPNALPHDLILWEAPDGTTIPTIPNHPGMLSCARQWKPYDEVVAQLAGHKAPLVFQWMELWVPGLDWGASMMPYVEAIHAQETRGFRQMLLTEYIQWALGRCETPRLRIPLDHSNYNNNFFQGGWGYENERTARWANRCESMLMAVEALCAGGDAPHVTARLQHQLRNLWARVLVSQNHDPYLAGSVPAYIDGLRTYQSELAIKQLNTVQQSYQEEGTIDAPLSPVGESFRLFNPCAWAITSPVMLELATSIWLDHGFQLTDGKTELDLAPVFRADSGNVLLGPVLMKLASYETRDWVLKPTANSLVLRPSASPKLRPIQGGQQWEVAQPRFEGVTFEPLVGEWRQIPTYFTSMHPNINIEVAHPRLEEAPVSLPLQQTFGGLDTAVWRKDLMRIKQVEEPALSVRGLVFAGEDPTSFVQFSHRLTGTIRFETGPRPDGTWRFRLRVRGAEPVVIADAPFSEEKRETERFYCARYVRLQWPDRHLLWCPSQNTLFRRFREDQTTVFECTVLDFSFGGTAHWDMRFHAGQAFTAAESMRLSETFHRRPVRIPAKDTAGKVKGVAIDNPQTMITHVFPAGRGATAVRLLNASDSPQTAKVAWPSRFADVTAADLEGNPLDGAWRPDRETRPEWQYNFRPWEIATFRVRGV